MSEISQRSRRGGPLGLLRELGVVVAVIAAGIAGFVALVYSTDYLWRPLGESEQARTGQLALVLAIAALAGGAYLGFQRGNVRWGQVRTPAEQYARRTAIVMTVVACVLAFGLWATEDWRADSRQVVEDYCAYGAVSQAQLDGCIQHVTFGDVKGRETRAARFALGAVDEVSCGEGSGPFCASVDQRRWLEELEPRDW